MTDLSALEKENKKLKKDLGDALTAIRVLEQKLAQMNRKLNSTYHVARDNQIKINSLLKRG